MQNGYIFNRKNANQSTAHTHTEIVLSSTSNSSCSARGCVLLITWPSVPLSDQQMWRRAERERDKRKFLIDIHSRVTLSFVIIYWQAGVQPTPHKRFRSLQTSLRIYHKITQSIISGRLFMNINHCLCYGSYGELRLVAAGVLVVAAVVEVENL